MAARAGEGVGMWFKVILELEGVSSLHVAEKKVKERIPEAKNVNVFAGAMTKEDFP